MMIWRLLVRQVMAILENTTYARCLPILRDTLGAGSDKCMKKGVAVAALRVSDAVLSSGKLAPTLGSRPFDLSKNDFCEKGQVSRID